ncbi:hypothetical protein [Ferrimicrobium sp.]|uniref:hypothetical protein n=1 Tax=Ferrimicrobium sp. TaxID=2926050 RepID=UPI00260D0819|nr:hypothetical protein [Ferrimicrobium sp.]
MEGRILSNSDSREDEDIMTHSGRDKCEPEDFILLIANPWLDDALAAIRKGDGWLDEALAAIHASQGWLDEVLGGKFGVTYSGQMEKKTEGSERGLNTPMEHASGGLREAE